MKKKPFHVKRSLLALRGSFAIARHGRPISRSLVLCAGMLVGCDPARVMDWGPSGVSAQVAQGPSALVDDFATVVAYRQGIDQAVHRVLSLSAGGPPFVIAKEYLEPRKAKVDVQRSKTIDYYVRHGAGNALLVTVPSDEAHEIGQPAERDGKVVVPITRGGLREEFVYTPSTGKLEQGRSETPGAPRLAFSDGSTVRVANGEAWVTVPGRKGQKLFSVERGTLRALDSVETGDGRHVVGTGRSDAGSFVWLASFTSVEGSESLRIVSKTKQLGQVVQLEAGFVESLPRRSTVLVYARNERFARIRTSILGPGLEPIWQQESSTPTSPGAAVVGVCTQDFVVVSGTRTDRVSDAVNVEVLTRNGKVMESRKYSVVTNGSLINMTAAPVGDASLDLLSNFEKLEDQRRADGWYSWRGYQVRRLSLRCGSERRDARSQVLSR